MLLVKGEEEALPGFDAGLLLFVLPPEWWDLETTTATTTATTTTTATAIPPMI